MTEQLCRITVKRAVILGPVADVTVITGYLVELEPDKPPIQDVYRPIEADEPDPENEVGYSRNVLEPLTIVYKQRKTELTKETFSLFRYAYSLYRTEGRSEFDFSEISEVLKGDGFAMSKNAVEKAIRRIAEALARIAAPLTLTFCKETLYVDAKLGIVN